MKECRPKSIDAEEEDDKERQDAADWAGQNDYKLAGTLEDT